MQTIMTIINGRIPSIIQAPQTIALESSAGNADFAGDQIGAFLVHVVMSCFARVLRSEE